MLKVLAAEVDTPAKKEALVVKFVAYMNEQAGAKVLTVAMVTLTVSNNRRGRSLQESVASVTFTIETYSELAKQQVALPLLTYVCTCTDSHTLHARTHSPYVY